MKPNTIALLLAALWAAQAPQARAAEATAPTAADGVKLDGFVKPDTFERVKLSPTGDYLAATVPMGDETVLAIIRLKDMTRTAGFRIGKHNHVDDFDWISPERVFISMAQKLGSRDEPQRTGEIFAINADGSQADVMLGYRVQSRGPGTRLQPKKVEAVAGFLVDDLPGDDRNVVISVEPFAADAYTRAERLDMITGQRSTLAMVPVRNARYLTDNAGVVRFALGFGTDRVNKLFYRADAKSEWTLLRSEGRGEGLDLPVGFSADNATAYFQSEMPKGPDAIVAMDMASGQRREVLRDARADPAVIIRRVGTQVPVGAFFADAQPRTVFFDPASPEARQYKSLEAAFPGHAVRVTSQSADGKLALVQVWSDRNPGEFFLFDGERKHARHVLSRREWFDPEAMAPSRPVRLKARDGLELNGFLTTPAGREAKSLPMVVMPHGGPYGVQDTWGFDNDAQVLAAAGYAVLQVNFRGSGGFGHAFLDAGQREWGGRMQDDVTDATRWAVEQGIADASRICLYGASYGGYAALMGVAKEPSLYRCAAGYVGVYDLPLMHTTGDIQRRGSGETYLRQWIGTPEALAAVSPTRLAGKIKVPVFLAAGGEDERAPQAHSERMEKALREAGVPVQTLYYKTEGHGFYQPGHQREFYARLLAFLAGPLGGKLAAPAQDEAKAKR